MPSTSGEHRDGQAVEASRNPRGWDLACYGICSTSTPFEEEKKEAGLPRNVSKYICTLPRVGPLLVLSSGKESENMREKVEIKTPTTSLTQHDASCSLDN